LAGAGAAAAGVLAAAGDALPGAALRADARGGRGAGGAEQAAGGRRRAVHARRQVGPARFARASTLDAMTAMRTLPHVDRVGVSERVAALGKRSIKGEAKKQGLLLAISML